MFGWLRESPGLARMLALTATAIVVSQTTAAYGGVIDWGTALLYGIALAVSMRWPIIMPKSGVRVILLTGLLMEALWHHGPGTAAMAILAEFGARMFVLYQGRYYWEWYRPLLIGLALFGAYGFQVLIEGGAVLQSHDSMSHLGAPALVMVYSFWAILNGAWILILQPPQRGRTRSQEFGVTLQQTWWVPLTFLLLAWPMMWVHRMEYPIEILVAIALVWLQSQTGPVFTTMHQDRAIAQIVRTAAPQPQAQRLQVHRVLPIAHSIGRILAFSERELRVLGYAALLQDYAPPGDMPAPLWLATRPSDAQQVLLQARIDGAIRLTEIDGALQEVADVIRYRFTAFDGSGYPVLSGDSIPLSAQVLASANAVVWLTSASDGPHLQDGQAAIAWLDAHAVGRFDPRIIPALSQSLVDMHPVVDVEHGLPEAVRQLQGLVSEPAQLSPLLIGIRRVWRQVRGQTGIAPDLPAEVQAVARLATYFASSTQAVQTAQIAAEVVGQLMGAKVAVAVREGADTELNLYCRAGYGFQVLNPHGYRMDLFAGPVSRAMLDQAPVQVADIREINNPLAQEFSRSEGVRSALFVPLVHRGRTTGLFLIGLTRHHWFAPREVGLIHLMAGQAAAALENARLLTEAEERVEHISKLNSLTETLLDNLSSSIIVVDPEGQLVMANATARARFADYQPLVTGMPLPRELAVAARVELALQGEAGPEEDVAWGSSILEMQSVPLKDGRGVSVGAICLARDVTQVRTMEQQVRRVEKLAAIGELAAGAAHEIRNPLTSIRGFIQLLQARAARADSDYFQIILNEIDRIDGIIRDMLLLAKPSDVVKVDSALPALLDEVLLLHQTELLRQNIVVARDYDPAVQYVAVDPKSFRQLLLNLVINAMQAMPYGGTLNLQLRHEAGDRVALAVSDSGVGISAENLKRLFVPFFTTKEEGTGLGLALCYSIVQAHGGKIDVESHVGQGTRFTITLPVR